MDLRETYDRIAEDWHRDHQGDTWWIEGTDLFASYLPPNGSVLDVGCAGGTKSSYLVEKGFSITGIDFSEKFIGIARRTVPAGEFHVMDMREVSRLGRMFDGVFAQASLLHIPHEEATATLQELLGALKAGGYIYVAVKRRKKGRPSEEEVVEDDYGYQYSRFFSYFTPEELRSLVESSGCTIVHEHSDPEFPTWMQVIGRKR